MPTPPMTNQRISQHIYHRAGFGPSIADLALEKKRTPETIVKYLLKDAEQSYKPFNVISEPIPDKQTMKMMSQEEKKEVKRLGRTYMQRLNGVWLTQMMEGKGVLREKMALFWHDHFACHLKNRIRIVQKYLNTLRKHALGNFRELLHAISKEPAMLAFLNNQQNKKAHPNENFAREVLELFTLGRGHYTEKDIKEAARAFTGWGFNMKAEFVFRKGQHDFGSKTFMGKTGNFDGNDILDQVLDNPQTAQYITEKLYRYLVNETIDASIVKKWAKQFYDSDYDIKVLVETILSSDHFYEGRNIGAKIKSPIEYLVSIKRMLNVTFETMDSPMFVQRALGQVLLFPPNVAGWPSGRQWIDSNSLMIRLQLPQVLVMATDFELPIRESFDADSPFKKKKQFGKMGRKVKATIDWQPLKKLIGNAGEEEAFDKLSKYFLQVSPKYLTYPLVKPHIQMPEQSLRMKALISRIVSTPEFQLC